MKSLLTLFLAVIFIHNANSQCADTANIYTFIYDGKTYEVIKELKTWTIAAACAIEREGYLVEINDANEQAAVYDAIINGAAVSPTYTSINNGGGIAYIWIGATDNQNEGIWNWDGNNDSIGISFWTGQGANGTGNGASVGGAYYNWGGTSTGIPKEPDNYGSGQHYGAIGLTGWPSGTTTLGIAGEWNDIIGTSQLFFVVEKDNSSGLQKIKNEKNELQSVFPNPTNGLLSLDKAYISIEVYSISGERLMQFQNTHSIDVSNLEKGTYLIQLRDNSVVKKGKFVLI